MGGGCSVDPWEWHRHGVEECQLNGILAAKAASAQSRYSPDRTVAPTGFAVD